MKISISKNIQRIQPSVTLAITAKAKAMKKAGIDVIALSAGEPDFDTPENIREAAIQAINRGFTKYTPAVGTPELREAICEKFKKENGLLYESSQVIVSCGGKHSISLAIMALVGEGDEVVIPAPYWVSYPEQVKLTGGTPVILEPEKENGLKITPGQLKKAISSRTKLFILNSPSNPSGVVYSEEELKELARVALEAGIFVLSDEIYEKIIYDGVAHHSIAAQEGMQEQTIVVNGVSKSYAMTGWRIGYAAGPGEIIQAMGKIQSQQTSNACSIAQAAALEALTGPQESVERMRKAFDKRRKYIVQRANSIPGISCPEPQGAFYVFPDVSIFYGTSLGDTRIDGSVSLCDFLLEEQKVACVPGAGFGADNHIRLSYATSMENIEQAMDRIETGLNKLK